VKRNALTRIGASLAAFFLTTGFMIISFTFFAYSKEFYRYQNNLNDTLATLKMSASQMEAFLEHFIQYFQNKSDTLQYTYLGTNGEYIVFFKANELLHMADVRHLFNIMLGLSTVMLLSGIAIMVVLIIRKRFAAIGFGLKVGNTIYLGFMIIIGIAALINFDDAFMIFHQILFPSGNFIFPFNSNMIKFLPESFFMWAALIIICCGLIFSLVSLVSGIIISKKEKRRINQKNAS
jgi:integral membrane protein (TIGR01906 family)